MRHTQVTAIEQADQQVHVVTDQDETLTTDWVLDATGRIPNIENLGLEKVGVVTTEHGIKVNSHLRTTVDNIYASGDVLDKKQPRLTPTAILNRCISVASLRVKAMRQLIILLFLPSSLLHHGLLRSGFQLKPLKRTD